MTNEVNFHNTIHFSMLSEQYCYCWGGAIISHILTTPMAIGQRYCIHQKIRYHYCTVNILHNIWNSSLIKT